MEVPTAVWPVLLFVLCASAVAVALLLVAAVANPARTNPVKQMPYESGMDPIHDTRRQFHVRFHLLAIAFLVFDVELLFLYPWAVATRPAITATTKGLSPAPPTTRAESAEEASTAEPGCVAQNGGTLSGASKTQPAHQAAASSRAVGIEAAVASGVIPSRDYAFWGAMVFVGLLGLGLVYDWRKGIFQWR